MLMGLQQQFDVAVVRRPSSSNFVELMRRRTAVWNALVRHASSSTPICSTSHQFDVSLVRQNSNYWDVKPFSLFHQFDTQLLDVLVIRQNSFHVSGSREYSLQIVQLHTFYKNIVFSVEARYSYVFHFLSLGLFLRYSYFKSRKLTKN